MKKTMIFGAGALTGALVCRLIMKEIMEKTIQKEVDAITEYYKDKVEEDAVYLEVDHPFSPILNTLKESVNDIEARVKKLGGISKKIQVEKFEKLSEDAKELAKGAIIQNNPYAHLANRMITINEGAPVRHWKENYKGMTDGRTTAKNIIDGISEDEPHIFEEDPEFIDGGPHPEIEIDDPYIISDIEFSEEYKDHDKITLWYYEKDNVVVDDREEIVDEVEYVLGDDSLQAFESEDSPSQNSIYVRNEKTGADYEVIRIFGSFPENVLGINRSDEDG